MKGSEMALQVFIAHSGQRLLSETESFASLDAFKAWVAKNSSIAQQDHISLTAQGKTVRLQTLQTEKQIYVYDRRIVQSSAQVATKSLTSEVPAPDQYNASKPPDTITDQNDLQAWKDLFMARRTWAMKVVDDCEAMSAAAQKRYDEIYVITQCLDAAFSNVEKHVKGVDERNRDIQNWSIDVQKEQAAYGTDWEGSLALLKSIPATAQMIRFITGRSIRKSKQSPCLEDLVDADEVRKAGKTAQTISVHISRTSIELGTKVDNVYKTADALTDKLDNSPTRSASKSAGESIQLMQDIEAIAKKINNDYENILGFANTPKNVSQASKSALLHTRNFLPSLSKRSMEMDEILSVATQMRNAVAAESLETMQGIAGLTSLLTELNSQFSKMDLDNNSIEAFHLLSILHTLPTTYASFLAEAIRRREWTEKVKTDSSTLANEMALFQEEEIRRRRKWQKATGSVLWGERAEKNVIGLEVNLQGDEDEWPLAKREELDELLTTVQSQNAKPDMIQGISKVISELNAPTKQQTKRAKAFKAGSIHEAALGKSTLLVRGDDDVLRILQDEKAKTEGKLRTAESRVRRLEALLHRQTQISRTSTGNLFQGSMPSPDAHTIANPMTSPRLNDELSRRSSVSSRRFSANNGADEKAVQHKLMGLEAELIAERERISGMEKEISAKTTAASDMKALVEEANSTKKDLMENFDAQQREFIEERKSLEAEIKKWKSKIEDLEDEMDRYLGSRENVDDRVRSLQDEIEKLHKEAAAEAQKTQGQIDFLRNDAKLQRETNEYLESQLANVRAENRNLLVRAEKAESTKEEQYKTLESLHVKLSETSPIPDDLPQLIDALDKLAEDVVAELAVHKHGHAVSKADKEAAEANITTMQSELTAIQDKLTLEERQTSSIREKLGQETAKYAALEAEFADERLQLSSLRTKIADGETGSGAMRTRLEEEERKVIKLSEDLAARMSQIGSLEEELRFAKEKSESTQTRFKSLAGRFDARTLRAKDLTQRVYTQNDRLSLLLEQLSYSITREGTSMSVHRLPRPERSSNNDSSDPGTSLRRSVSGAVARKAMADSADLELLHWMNSEDLEVEGQKYEAYLNSVNSFDIEVFCNVIAKRVRDLEYTMKKYSRDARAYREKSHGAQKEAHEKIAFKNFKEGDLALFLPTRNQATGAWAAFNVGAPHYFLREQDSHKLRHRDWLLARITKIENRVVDLSKSISSTHINASDGRSFGEASNGGDSFEDDNPFDLSDGLRWYLIDAHEEKPGAPTTPGLGKSTVASTHVDASADIRRTKKLSHEGVEGINKTLSKSLDSRRSSNNSKKSLLAASKPIQNASGTASLKAIPAGQAAESSSDAQMIQDGSKQGNGGNGDGDKTSVPPEVRTNIDDLMGP
ncbi:autophagy-related protein 11 [Phlyctema vagabunda]|uniref:Autophagy-related protein 11 n=1 Tax=Phlyctema vagabunda TaxID=108571 RepID=A0ABR4PBV5_9HELO